MDVIFRAILEDDRELAKKLLKANAKLATLLNREARLFESQIFHWLYVGDTPLHLAAAGYRVEIARTLLAAGADVNAAANSRRGSPLHYAADGYINGPAWDAKRQVKTIQRLLAEGADLHAQDKKGATALHRAVRTRCAAAVRCLLRAGGDPTAKNNSGSTPFHLAVQNTGRGGSGADVAIAAQQRIIEAFLEFGVSANLTDGSGKSVRDCAKSGWVREILGRYTRRSGR